MPEVVIPTGRLWIDESSPWSGNHSSGPPGKDENPPAVNTWP